MGFRWIIFQWNNKLQKKYIFNYTKNLRSNYLITLQRKVNNQLILQGKLSRKQFNN